MKKYLLGTTALAVAALMASPLSAADKAKKLVLGVGGFMEHAIGYAKNDDLTDLKYSNVAIESDAELLFRGKVTTDSGIKFDARFELEANQDGETVSIDEMFVQISTPSLGLIEIGSADHVTDALSQGAPKVGWGLADADDWIPRAGTAHATNIFGGDSNNDGSDEKKINYYTPSNWKKATGLQAAIGYTPNEQEASNAATFNSTTTGPVIAAGIAFDRKINGIGVYANYNYSNQTDTSNNDTGRTGHGGGLELKSGPFTLAGAYTRTLDSQQSSSSVDGHAYSVGGAYKMGKWEFGLAYAKTVQEADNTTAALVGQDDKYSAWDLGAKYDLGKGINWRTSVYFVKQDEEKGDLEATENSHGWAVVTGIVLGF
jgi:hypothetical protein